MIEGIIDNILANFDFSYCLVINILTYIVIQCVSRFAIPSTWGKRVILLITILIVGVIYYYIDTPIKILVNSTILAPVSWSWVFKPLCKCFNIDYPKF